MRITVPAIYGRAFLFISQNSLHSLIFDSFIIVSSFTRVHRIPLIQLSFRDLQNQFSKGIKILPFYEFKN